MGAGGKPMYSRPGKVRPSPYAGLLAAGALLFAGCGRPEPSAAPGVGAAETVRLVTCNVLAERVSDERVGALMELLAAQQADLYALQEAAPWFTGRLAAEDWAKRYRRADSERMDAHAPGGLLILSRHPVVSASYGSLPSRAGRGVLIARLLLGRSRLAVATVHLESPPADGPLRAKQLEEVFRLLDLEKARDAVLMGDLNFADGAEPETSVLKGKGPAFADLWRVLHPHDPGFTWNMEKSALARRNSFPEDRSARIDRVLLRSKEWRVRAISIIGDEPVTGGGATFFPSDHFGLAATIERPRASREGEPVPRRRPEQRR